MEKKINCINCRVVAKEWDVYFDMACEMLSVITENNAKNKPTVMIVPVGPTDQYPILAKLINQFKVSLKNVWFFNMDEYLTSPDMAITREHPLSFESRMYREFYDRVDKNLIMPENQRLFPRVGKEAEYDKLIEELGGVTACFGGLGINGHIAFNEPEPSMTADDFGSLGTRVLPISRETRTINAYGYQRGDLYGMPEYCITVGMKQILSAQKIYIALNRPWQAGPFKHAMFTEETAGIPATLLRRNSNVTYCMYEDIAEGTIN